MHMELSDVSYCTALTKESALDDMTLEELKPSVPVFEEDIYDAISMKTCVENEKYDRCTGKERNGESDRNRRSISCDRVMESLQRKNN